MSGGELIQPSASSRQRGRAPSGCSCRRARRPSAGSVVCDHDHREPGARDQHERLRPDSLAAYGSTGAPRVVLNSCVGCTCASVRVDDRAEAAPRPTMSCAAVRGSRCWARSMHVRVDSNASRPPIALLRGWRIVAGTIPVARRHRHRATSSSPRKGANSRVPTRPRSAAHGQVSLATSDPLSITVVLQPSHRDALDRLLRDQNDPASPQLPAVVPDRRVRQQAGSDRAATAIETRVTCVVARAGALRRTQRSATWR